MITVGRAVFALAVWFGLPRRGTAGILRVADGRSRIRQCRPPDLFAGLRVGRGGDRPEHQGSGFEVPVWVGVVGGLLVAGFFLLVETLMKGFTLRGFSTATFGLLVGAVLCLAADAGGVWRVGGGEYRR